MKALGIIRRVDDLGRVVIPKEVRKSQGWEPGQALEMFMEDDKFIIKAYGMQEKKENAVKILERAMQQADPDMQDELKEVIDTLKQQL